MTIGVVRDSDLIHSVGDNRHTSPQILYLKATD